MSEQWQIHATLGETEHGLRLEMVATRQVAGKTEQTADVVMVDHPAEARLECHRFAQTLGVETYTLVDRRAA